MPKGKEVRADVDGELYTRAQFVSHYGPDKGLDMWGAAKGRLPFCAADGEEPDATASTSEEDQIEAALADLCTALGRDRQSVPA